MNTSPTLSADIHHPGGRLFFHRLAAIAEFEVMRTG